MGKIVWSMFVIIIIVQADFIDLFLSLTQRCCEKGMHGSQKAKFNSMTQDGYDVSVLSEPYMT